MGSTKQHLSIDIDKVIASKSSSLAKYTPKFLINWIKRIVHQDELNQMLEYNADKEGAEFAKGTLKYLNASAKITFLDKESLNKNGRYIFVSNHPLGGLDGLILINELGSIMGDIKFVVNDILMNIKPLESIFVPVNKHGKMSRHYGELINNAYSSNSQILYFPAGLCSRLINGKITDTPWQKNFLRQALKYNRDIVPIYFGGKNSSFFYKLSKFRKKVGIKFNIEMIFLPDEMIRQKNSIFDVVIGKPIKIEQLRKEQKEGKKLEMLCSSIREISYNLKKHI